MANDDKQAKFTTLYVGDGVSHAGHDSFSQNEFRVDDGTMAKCNYPPIASPIYERCGSSTTFLLLLSALLAYQTRLIHSLVMRIFFVVGTLFFHFRTVNTLN